MANRHALSLAALALAAPAFAFAQRVEITPTGGFRFGGSFTEPGTGAALALEDAVAFGARLDVRIAEAAEIELLFSRQPTTLKSDGFFTGTPLFDVKTDIYHVGGCYLFREPAVRVRPYMVVTMGATRFRPAPSDRDRETRFSASLGGGIRAYLGGHLGFRFEVRGFFTVIQSSSSVFCSSAGTCFAHVAGSELSQGEASGGLILRF